MASPRGFPPPWPVEEPDACFIVRDTNGQAIIDRQSVELGRHRMPAEITDRRFPPPWTIEEQEAVDHA
jgi:hypothetical protein